MDLRHGKKSGVIVLLLVLGLAVSARAGIVEDLTNLIKTVQGLLAQSKSSAKAAAENEYNGLESELWTASSSVTNTAAAARQSAYDSRLKINQIIDHSLVIYPQDLSGPLQGILSCNSGTGTSITETTSILSASATAAPIISSEITAARRTSLVLSASASAAIRVTEAAAAEMGILTQKLQAWSTALQKMNRETNDVATAIKEARYRDLPQQQTEMQQAQTTYQTAWSQQQAQATKTRTALSQARLGVQIAMQDAANMAVHLQKALDLMAKVTDQVATASPGFNAGYASCTTAVSQYADSWNQAVANSRQRYLGCLTQPQRDAIANLDSDVAQADSLFTSIGNAVAAALTSAKRVVSTAESAIETAVSAMIMSFVKFLQSFLMHAWDLDMTRVQNDLNTLTGNIGAEVAKIVMAVQVAARTSKMEAENQLAALAGIAQRLLLLYQQLYQVSSKPTVAIRTGYVLAPPTTLSLTPLKQTPLTSLIIQTSTASKLNSVLAAYVQALTKSVDDERVLRKLPVR